MPRPVNLVSEVRMVASGVAPPGWLLCDGSLVNRVTYAALFAAVGISYDPGDGVNTFGLPDLRGRAPIGAGLGTAGISRPVGTKVGTETHLLAAAESGVPAHTHTQNPHDHTVPGQQNAAAGGSFTSLVANVIAPVAVSSSVATNNANAAAAAAQAHNNMQPSLALTFIICWDAG